MTQVCKLVIWREQCKVGDCSESPNAKSEEVKEGNDSWKEQGWRIKDRLRKQETEERTEP